MYPLLCYDLLNLFIFVKLDCDMKLITIKLTLDYTVFLFRVSLKLVQQFVQTVNTSKMSADI